MKTLAIGLVVIVGAGCGVTKEQLDQRISTERRWSEQERKQFKDAVDGRVTALEAKIDDALEKMQRQLQDAARDMEALGLRVKHLESSLATIQTTAIGLDSLRKDSQGRLAEMKKLHETFIASVESLDEKIQRSQKGYRDIIRKNIQALKEQYTYFTNLLRELEEGRSGGGSGG